MWSALELTSRDRLSQQTTVLVCGLHICDGIAQEVEIQDLGVGREDSDLGLGSSGESGQLADRVFGNLEGVPPQPGALGLFTEPDIADDFLDPLFQLIRVPAHHVQRFFVEG